MSVAGEAGVHGRFHSCSHTPVPAWYLLAFMQAYSMHHSDDTDSHILQILWAVVAS